MCGFGDKSDGLGRFSEKKRQKTMKTITLKSRWFDLEMNLRVSNALYEKLANADRPIDFLDEDMARVSDGYLPHYFTEGQILRAKRYFGEDDCNYWESIEL